MDALPSSICVCVCCSLPAGFYFLCGGGGFMVLDAKMAPLPSSLCVCVCCSLPARVFFCAVEELCGAGYQNGSFAFINVCGTACTLNFLCPTCPQHVSSCKHLTAYHHAVDYASFIT